MTVDMRDDTPEDWHKLSFSSAYLPQIDNYISQHAVTACIRGAITFGVMGAAVSIACFADADAFNAFESWYNQNLPHWQPCQGIYIAMNMFIDPESQQTLRPDDDWAEENR